MKYLIQCKYCGAILFKTQDPLAATLRVEIKCPGPNCKKLLKFPDDILTNLEKKKKPGLEKSH